jgi:hypothetical protein
MNEAVERRLRQIPRKYQHLYLRSMDGKLSPRNAIKVACYHCMCFEGDGKGQSLQQMVANCSSLACPLWAYRPLPAESKTLVPSSSEPQEPQDAAE